MSFFCHANSMNNDTVRIVEASNMLNRKPSLSKIQAPVDALPEVSPVQAHLSSFSEVTRRHRSVRYDDNGDRFNMQRMFAEKESYPIQAPICQPTVNPGFQSRLEGRDEIIHYTGNSVMFER
jgi:hypothetical protein